MSTIPTIPTTPTTKSSFTRNLAKYLTLGLISVLIWGLLPTLINFVSSPSSEVVGRTQINQLTGAEEWFDKNGRLHNENGPAVIETNGSKHWVQNGVYFREGGLPHVERADGSKQWYDKNGEFHNENGPAVIEADGSKYWYQNGVPFREGGLPHVERADGTKGWFDKNGSLRDRPTLEVVEA